MHIGTKVKVYRNLNNGMIAVRSMDNKVLGYCNTIILSDCTTKVQIGTRNTIVRKFEETGKREKNVHAFIIGTIVSIDMPLRLNGIDGICVSYNPYKADHFYNIDTHEEFTTAKLCYMSTDGKGFPMHVIAQG